MWRDIKTKQKALAREKGRRYHITPTSHTMHRTPHHTRCSITPDIMSDSATSYHITSHHTSRTTHHASHTLRPCGASDMSYLTSHITSHHMSRISHQVTQCSTMQYTHALHTHTFSLKHALHVNQSILTLFNAWTDDFRNRIVKVNSTSIQMPEQSFLSNEIPVPMFWFDALLALEVLPQLTAPTGEPIPMNLDCFGVVTGCVGFKILQRLMWSGTVS